MWVRRQPVVNVGLDLVMDFAGFIGRIDVHDHQRYVSQMVHELVTELGRHPMGVAQAQGRVDGDICFDMQAMA